MFQIGNGHPVWRFSAAVGTTCSVAMRLSSPREGDRDQDRRASPLRRAVHSRTGEHTPNFIPTPRLRLWIWRPRVPTTQERARRILLSAAKREDRRDPGFSGGNMERPALKHQPSTAPIPTQGSLPVIRRPLKPGPAESRWRPPASTTWPMQRRWRGK